MFIVTEYAALKILHFQQKQYYLSIFFFKTTLWVNKFYQFVWFDSLRPSQQFFSYVFLHGLNQYMQGLMCFAQGHNAVMSVWLEPTSQALYHWASALPLQIL